jgi:hypothetical protein
MQTLWIGGGKLMITHEISRVFEVTLPIATMPSASRVQIGFSAEGQSFSLLMSRADFQRLGRKIQRLLDDTPPPARNRGPNLLPREK